LTYRPGQTRLSRCLSRSSRASNKKYLFDQLGKTKQDPIDRELFLWQAYIHGEVDFNLIHRV